MSKEIAYSYRILELDPTASAEAVKEAYRDQIKVWHPDRFLNDPRLLKKANERAKQINNAYETITAHLKLIEEEATRQRVEAERRLQKERQRAKQVAEARARAKARQGGDFTPGAEGVLSAGLGTGALRLGARVTEVEALLGPGTNRSRYEDVYFIDYEEKGIQARYSTAQDKVLALFFYCGEVGYEHFAPAHVTTDRGITWASTTEQVLKAYGKPKEDLGCAHPRIVEVPREGRLESVRERPWRRLVFRGIDFRFVEGLLVRIYIGPG